MVGVKVNYPGLIKDRLPSGNTRYLVRVEGNPSKRITLKVPPHHPMFDAAYRAARAGEKLSIDAHDPVSAGTVKWLAKSYIAHLETMVAADRASPLTLKQRRPFADELCAFKSNSENSKGKRYADLPAQIPERELTRFLNSLQTTPGKRKNMLKFIKAMYVWGKDAGHVERNPAADMRVEYRSAGGATPWSVEDLEKYRKAHPPGTMAHLTLTLFMFTACRISDAVRLGKENEERRNGQLWLVWQPAKRGSMQVEIPVLPPLQRALSARTVIGPKYLLTAQGQPFRSPEGLRNKLQVWCKEAGLQARSSHGIRKAAGHLLAMNGATQYEITAVHGHANASTSEIYTRGYDRQMVAQKAMDRLRGMTW